MPQLDNDWIKKQLGKVLAAEQSLLDSEKQHRDSIQLQEVRDTYDRIIQQDEKHVGMLQGLGSKYGLEGGGGGGGMMSGLKSAAEGLMTSDPFQLVADDIAMKGASLTAGRVWCQVFRDIGDEQSASMMDEGADEDKKHIQMMRELMADIGTQEAQGRQMRAA